MEYFSLNYNAKDVSFLEAVRKGLAPDRGLYFPKNIPKLEESFIKNLKKFSDHEIAYEVIKPYVGSDIDNNNLKKIIQETLSFDFPIVKITDKIAVIELFHGPSLAFKDVGARFMARCLSQDNFIKKGKNLTVLVATSGDTGGAVADGFFKVKGIDVIILYPKGKVSDIQERQLTTLGENITALEVNGSFDDCQDMVKTAFVDQELKDKIYLTSANSINIGRWLAQMFYYFIAYKNRPNPEKKLLISVPSGNFGNICAGMMTKKIGLPIDKFIASNNLNNVVERYLKNGLYKPKNTIHTISNAMDVGNPSNFIRISELYNNKLIDLKADLFAYSYSDSSTISSIKELIDDFDYIADPHAAIGYLGAKEFINLHPKANCIILETAPVSYTHLTLPTNREV